MTLVQELSLLLLLVALQVFFICCSQFFFIFHLPFLFVVLFFLATKTEGVLFSDNIVTRYGNVFREATALFSQRASGVSLLHNEVSDGFDFKILITFIFHVFFLFQRYYSPIGVGWSWGFATGVCTDRNTISYNHLHHYGKRIMSDLGAIYTLGIQIGTVVYEIFFLPLS